MHNKTPLAIPDPSLTGHCGQDDADFAQRNASTISRRHFLHTGRALAIAHPLSIGASALLLTGPAQATTLVVRVKPISHTYNVTIGGTTYIYEVRPTDTSGTVVITVRKYGSTTRSAIYRDNNYTIVYNTASVVTAGGITTCNLSDRVNSVKSGLLDTDIDGGRRLQDIEWNNEPGSTIITEGSLADQSDANVLFWETYRLATGVVKSGAVLRYMTAGAECVQTMVLKFAGSNHSTFVSKRNAYVNAVKALHQTQGKARTTLVLASTVAIAGVAGSVFSFGLGVAAVGGALATLAGNSLLNGSALIEATKAVSEKWSDLALWVEEKTGENLAR
ncbi:MAG: hypothetical protein RL227_34 [Pseudomonadota bacterium]